MQNKRFLPDIPHQAGIDAKEPIPASFSPGEALGASAPVQIKKTGRCLGAKTGFSFTPT